MKILIKNTLCRSEESSRTIAAQCWRGVGSRAPLEVTTGTASSEGVRSLRVLRWGSMGSSMCGFTRSTGAPDKNTEARNLSGSKPARPVETGLQSDVPSLARTGEAPESIRFFFDDPDLFDHPERCLIRRFLELPSAGSNGSRRLRGLITPGLEMASALETKELGWETPEQCWFSIKDSLLVQFVENPLETSIWCSGDSKSSDDMEDGEEERELILKNHNNKSLNQDINRPIIIIK